MDQKTLDRLLSLPRNPRSDNDFSDSDKQFVDALHRSILGSPVRDCSCRNRYADAYYEIMAALPKETRKLIKMSKQQKRYHLKGGYVIYHEGSHYTNVTLTDDIAKAYLAKHPDAAFQFDSIPEQEDSEAVIKKAKETLDESRDALKTEEITEESANTIAALNDTLEEAIKGGDINSIKSAVDGVLHGWGNAERKTEEPKPDPEPEVTDTVNSEQETESEPQPEPKKGKK